MTWDKRMVFLKGITNSTLQLRKNELLVRLFGELEIIVSWESDNRVTLKAAQTRDAFALLVLRRNQHIPLDALAQAIWNDFRPDPLYDAVKNVIYRIKRALQPLGCQPLIVSDSGSFAISPKVNIITDAELLEKQHKCIYNTEFNDEMLLQLYQQMIALHRGPFLAGQKGSVFIENLRTYYLSLYADTVKKYLSLLEKHERYLDMIEVVTKALEYEPHEPTLLWYQVHILIQQRRFDLAQSHYKQVQSFLSAEQRRSIEKILSSH